MLRGAGELAVRCRDQRVDRQQAARVPGDACPVARPPRPSPSAAGRPALASPSRIASSSRTACSAAGSDRLLVDGGQQHVGVLRPDVLRIECLDFERLPWPPAISPRRPAAPPGAAGPRSSWDGSRARPRRPPSWRRPAGRVPPRSPRGHPLGLLPGELGELLI